MISKTVPAPFDPKAWKLGDYYRAESGDQIYWEQKDPVTGRHLYLFHPSWDGHWKGHGKWRLGCSGRGVGVVSILCDTPEQVHALYVSYLLTSEWPSE